MRIRSSLSAKLLLWGFLNLAVVAGIIYFSMDIEFRIGPDSRLFGRAQGRFPMLSLPISRELERTPISEWDRVIERYSEDYLVQFSLVTPEGKIVAGSRDKLPLDVATRISSQFGRQGMKATFCTNGQCQGVCSGAGCADASRPRRHTFKMKTSEPRLFWAGVRVPRFIHTAVGPVDLVLVGRSKSMTGNRLFMDPTPWVVMGFMTVLVSILLWIPMIRHITRPLGVMTTATEKISTGMFDVKLDERRNDEIGRLSRGINHMSGRLARMIFGQKRFLGDAAHELASPLARMQLGIGILEDTATDENRERILALKDEIQQMSELVNGLLSFARSDSSSGRVRLTRVNLFQVAALTVDREIPDESIDVVVNVSEDIEVTADFDLMLRALGNLVRNAVRYAGTAGPIEVTAAVGNNTASITVSDHGPGVPSDMIDQIFEPFYRVESSRGRDSGGVGLGLAIVRTAVLACHGAVHASNRAEGGFTVSIELPLAPAPTPAKSSPSSPRADA